MNGTRILVMMLAMFCLSCRTPSSGEPASVVERLDGVVRPVSQEVHVTLDPAADGYRGETAVRIHVREAVEVLRFHAQDLCLGDIAIEGFASGQALPFTVGGKGTVTVALPAPLLAGEHVLTVSFARPYGRKGTGIYKVERDGKAYLFTQMEPEHARSAFPCWDEPGFKIPWRVTVSAPGRCLVVANTPPESEQPGNEGMTRWNFMQTPPMPSYLVALAVGPLDAVDVDGLSVPGRIVALPTQMHLTGAAAEVTPPLLTALETYFETPYPYRKLDQIAVPEFNYGAMENVGAIIYRDTILLIDPESVTVGQRRRLALVVAHELAHMWFGNLVTPAWWDDLWLNESFASWIALKMVNGVFPELAMENRDIDSRRRAMDADALRAAHPVRNPVTADADMTHLFDALAYSKGMAVLGMIEDWLGEETFRQGMVRYMTVNRWGNADAFDLADALDTLGDHHVNLILNGFVTQPGIPLIEIKPAGDRSIRLTQRRYTEIGITPPGDPRWPVPMTLAYGDGAASYTRKVLLTEQEQTVDLEIPIFGHPGHWLHPNAEEKGYYRWRLPEVELASLAGEARDTLSIRRRIGFIDNLGALLNAGELAVDDYLGMVAAFRTDSDPEVMAQVVQALNHCREECVPESLADAYGRWLSEVLGPMLERIGLQRQAGEDVRLEDLRSSLIHTLGWHARDSRVLVSAHESAAAYLDDPYAVDPALAGAFLRLAARDGNVAFYEQVVEAYESTEDPTRKRHYLGALGSFRDPALMQRARAYSLSGALPPQDATTIPRDQADTDSHRQAVFDWLVRNYPQVVAQATDQAPNYYPWLVCGQSRDLLQQGEAFFMDSARRSPVLAEEFAKVSDVVRRRIALQDMAATRLEEFLRTIRPRP